MKKCVSFVILPPMSRWLSTMTPPRSPDQPWRFRSHSTSCIAVWVRVSMRARSPSAVSCPCNPWRSSRLRISRRSQDSLIGLEREDVIGLLVDDFPSDASLTPHRVCGDDRALDRHHVERGGMATISSEFSVITSCTMWMAPFCSKDGEKKAISEGRIPDGR